MQSKHKGRKPHSMEHGLLRICLLMTQIILRQILKTEQKTQEKELNTVWKFIPKFITDARYQNITLWKRA